MSKYHVCTGDVRMGLDIIIILLFPTDLSPRRGCLRSIWGSEGRCGRGMGARAIAGFIIS